MIDLTGFLHRLHSCTEWLLVNENGRSFPLSHDEIEVNEENGRSLVGFVDETGYHSRRLRDVRIGENDLEIDISGQFGKDRETVRLVPRVSAEELAAEVEAARSLAANVIAGAIAETFNAEVSRVSLNTERGRIAVIELRLPGRKRIAALADVTGELRPDMLIASAMLRYEKLTLRKRDPIDEFFVIFEKKTANRGRDIFAVLNDKWRARLTAALIERSGEKPLVSVLTHKRPHDLWRSKAAKLSLNDRTAPTRLGRAVVSLSPDEIDIIRSKNGETLRFKGLPFLRIRRLMERERCWLINGKQNVLLPDNDLENIRSAIDPIAAYRSSSGLSKRHVNYRNSGEAWLESILRRDISQLDGNLVISPIYDQFRSTSGKIDLLAIRNDGRLVIIEIKTRPDREMVFQSVEYWRRIELQRRRGELAAANLFGEKQIADRPAIIYLAAPAWSYHPDVDLFAESLSPEIELWRFELHENWREEIAVVARKGYNAVPY